MFFGMADSLHEPPPRTTYRSPNTTEPNLTTSFGLPASRKSKLEGIARIERRSVAAILRFAIDEYIERWETGRDQARAAGELADGDHQP